MTALVLGLLSGWLVLRFARVTHGFPWRVVDLRPTRSDAPSGGAVDRTSARAPGTPMNRRCTGRRAGSGHRVRPVDRPGRSALAARAPRDRRLRHAIQADLPAVVDLLHVAVSAGHSLHSAVAAVGRTGSGPISAALAEADQQFCRGGALVDELEQLPDRLGPQVRTLSTTLVIAASSGAPLGPTLQRLADSERRRLRRRTEERVRRLPVLLLAPLVGLVLPAFVLLTVMPVAITTARTGLDPLTDRSPVESSTSANAPSPRTSDTFRSPP